MVSIIGAVLYWALFVFVVAMWGRLVLDFVRAFKPYWRPTGPVLVISNIVFTITDPPLKFIRRFVKPMNLGQISLDFGWTIVMLAAIVLMYVAEVLMYS